MTETKDRYINRLQPLVTSPIQGKQYLLVIAINNYQHLRTLNNAVKDATDLVKVLVSKYQFKRKHVYQLLEEEATRENILDSLESLRQVVTPDDKLVIYFAGHGHKEGDMGYWIPVEAKAKRTNYIANINIINEYISGFPAKHIFIIADACFSVSLLESSITRSGSPFNVLAQLPSRWVLASGRGEVSDGRGVNSPFASCLLEYLRKNLDKSLAVSKLIHHVKEAVIEKVDDKLLQCPEGGRIRIDADKGGEFIFYLSKIKSRREEYIFKKEIPQLYLKLYPDGKYAERAREVLSSIKSSIWYSKNITNEWYSKEIHREVQRKYDSCEPLVEGLSKVSKAGKYGFLNNKGEEIIPLIYDYVYNFSGGLAVVKKASKLGYIDANNKVVIPFDYDLFWGDFKDGFVVFERNNKYGFLNRSGKELRLEYEYEDAEPFSGGLAKVKRSGKWGFIDTNGVEVIPAVFNGVSNFGDRKAEIEYKGKRFEISMK